MANALPDNYKGLKMGDAAAVNALPDFDTDAFRATLVDHAVVTPNPAVHDDLADYVTAVIAESSNLTGQAFPSMGVLDFADFTFPTVSGADCESLNWHLETGVDATSTWWLFIDTATGLPVTPNGGDINIVLNGSGLMGF